jgi:YggT family protein
LLDGSVRALVIFVDLALEIYVWILLAATVLAWLVGFKIIDAHTLAVVRGLLDKVTEPVRGPIRRVLPDLRDIDISPIIAIVLIVFLRYLIALYVLPLAS